MRTNALPLFSFLFLLGLLSVSAQEVSRAQIEAGKEKLRQDSTLAKQARDAVAENPDLINRVPADRRSEVLDVLNNTPVQAQLRTSLSAKDSANDGLPAKDPLSHTGLKQSPINETGLGRKDSLGSRYIPHERIFGRALFNEYIQQAPVSEIPDEYVIAAGDEILMRLWGRYNLDKKYTIGKDGYVFLDPLNKQVYLLGMTYARLKDMIRIITRDVPGVEGEARILATRAITVHVAGEAMNPGTIAVPPFCTFWQALMLSRGPGELGSVRKIKLIRRGVTVNTLDIYSYLRTGVRPEQNIKDDDVIFFDRIEKADSVSGFVQRSGWYELLANETLNDLVSHAGGLTATEFSSIGQIDRIIPVEQRTQDGPTRTVIDLDLSTDGWKKQSVLNGDIITTKAKKTRYQNDVFVFGKGVPVPGRYSVTSGATTIWEVLEKAGGLAPGFSTKGELQRVVDNSESTRSTMIDFSDEALLRQTTVTAGDTIRTYLQRDFRDLTTVKSSGFVRDSVEVPYSDSISLFSLLKRSGGTRDGALDYVYIKRTDDFGTVSYERESIADTAQASRVLLKPRDEVIAFDYRNFNKTFPVGVLAYGSQPVLVEYSRDLTLNILILRLGGLNLLVDSSHVEIVVPNMKSAEIMSDTKVVELNRSTASDASLLAPGAMVIFRKDPKKNEPKYVTIVGEVMSPGSYALKTNHDNIHSLIMEAGGLTSRANPYGIRILRHGYFGAIPVQTVKPDPLKLKNSFVLNQGDRIVVGQNDYLVTIRGAVFDSGVTAYNSSYAWKDYIRNGAGGWLDSADVKRTYIRYPNGMKYKGRQGLFGSKKVVPGSEIVVPYKPPTPPAKAAKEFDYMKFATFMSMMATTMLTLVLVTNALK
jgi:protein involved in polysaccharide export with SLBB domain